MATHRNNRFAGKNLCRQAHLQIFLHLLKEKFFLCLALEIIILIIIIYFFSLSANLTTVNKVIIIVYKIALILIYIFKMSTFITFDCCYHL